MFFSLVRFVWKMMTRIAIRKKIICLLATYLHKKPKPLSHPHDVEEIKEKEDNVSSDVPIDTIVMPIRITFDNPIDFNDHFSKPKDFKKNLPISFDSTESSILPSPVLDSDSPFTAELSASVNLNSLGNEDKVFKSENHHFSCSSTRLSIQVICRPDPTKDLDAAKPDTNFVLTSGAIRGRNGLQGLEEPMSDEVLREMCDKNYHQLLPLIAEKMQKEKEQKDKLNAVKARLIYGEESGIKIRSREESHYSESKTPTARTEPRRRHGGGYSRSPSPHASVFKRLKKNRSPSPRPRPRKEGGVFNRLGRKEPATSARPDSRQRSPRTKRNEVEARRRQQKGTPSRTTSQYSESEDKSTIAYEELRTAFKEKLSSANKLYQDPEENNHIKQRDGESTEDFMERYKAEVLDVEGAPECMRISGFMHGITHPGGSCCTQSRPEKSTFVLETVRRGEQTEFQERLQRPDRKPDRFSLLTKTPKEIFALEKGKFKAPPPMQRKQIDEMIKAGKLSQFIKELKQNDKPKAPKKGEAFGKDKPLTILMIQPWERITKPRITQSFSPETAISFPPLREEGGTEGPMIIEADIGGHFVHRVYIDGGASSEVLYEHCFIKLRKEIRDQMVPQTKHLSGFCEE
ncbi:hypothetical protein Tco_0204521 [Tanacetum coccineum]